MSVVQLSDNKKPFNSYQGKYQYDNWNDIITMQEPYRSKHFIVLTHLVKTNFYAFMNKLLRFKPDPVTIHPWVSRRYR